MLPFIVRAQVALWALDPRSRPRSERGQTTAEYALVLLGAAAVALLVVAWAANSERIGRLLNAVLDKVIEQVT
ncbi:MAG: DUF4244 domain-containing protein [Acidimicrobiales bacterium]|nr:DUF4244 domain-containing protein [Acidimicrobiales bacterium]